MKMTFRLRNRRRRQISDALRQLEVFGHPHEPELQASLASERFQLEEDRWEVSDRTYMIIGRKWIWANTALSVDDVDSDAVLIALWKQPLLTTEIAAAINAIPRDSDTPPADLADRVTAISGNSDVFVELAFAAHRRFISSDPTYPYDDVGIMLPLRLETLFDPLPDGRWRLSLRVVPDEPSVLRDNPNINGDEVAALEAFWNGIDDEHRPDPARPPRDWVRSPAGEVAWERLTERVGARRAAWLVPEFPPAVDGDRFVSHIPEARIGSPEPNRVGGMPESLVVWAVMRDADGIEEHRAIGSLHPRGSQLKLPLPGDRNAVENNWLVSWDRAVREFEDERDEDGVGMGVVIDLPQGVTPHSMETLYVLGIGDDDPAEHFGALANAGDLGIARLGVATNAVQGAPAQDLANEVDGWRTIAEARLGETWSPRLGQLGRHLTGEENGIAAIPGAKALGDDWNLADTEESRRFVRALWPVLWGHFLRDHWQWQDSAHWLSKWANDNLCPEGPLPPLRIGDQPYGLLPVTALADWEAGPDDADRYHGAEALLARLMIDKRAIWAQAARGLPTSNGASTEELIDLIGRDGISAGYSYQAFAPFDLLASFFPDPVAAGDVVDSLYQAPTAVMRAEPATPGPFREYVAVGFERPLELNLIEPTRIAAGRKVADMLHALLCTEGGPVCEQNLYNFFLEFMQRILPDSLLIRLLIYSVIVNQGFCAQSANGGFAALVNKESWDDNDPNASTVRFWRMMYFELLADLNAREPMKDLFAEQIKAALELAAELDSRLRDGPDPLGLVPEVGRIEFPPERLATLERAFRATLDTAAHRIDPWIVGIAWRRVLSHSESPDRNYRLGVYGWVDGPFDGRPGPNDAGLLHAPSQPQAMASVILRDKFLSTQRELADPGALNPWAMTLDSSHVRQAVELRDEVRLGSHLHEVLGRWVEEIIGSRNGVARIRALCPLLGGDAEQPQVVCDGRTALQKLLDPPGDAGGQPFAVMAAALSIEQRHRLEHLHRSLDSYADLLVADAVQQVVTGHADLAGELMDAAAGLGRPPTLEFTRTPPSGFQVANTVLSVLPTAPISDDLTRSPIEIADASLAAFVADACGPASDWKWVRRSDHAAVVTLADLGLEPFEIASVGGDILCAMAEATSGIAASDLVPPDQHRLLRELLPAFGNQPATTSDLLESSSEAQALRAPTDDAIRSDLAARLTRLRDAAQADINTFSGASTGQQRLAALRRALSWGVVPTSEPTEQSAFLRALLEGEPPADPSLLERLVASAADALRIRLQAAPADATGLDSAAIARALAELATPDGKLSILGRWPRSTLQTLSSIEADTPAPTLDTEWLTTMATVRPALARLEALQLAAQMLDSFTPLAARSNAPTDPWLRTRISELLELRADRGAAGLTTPQLAAAFGPPGAWQGDTVAAGLIDFFTEAIPMPPRATYAAFGFNAPSARAPQAILLAVPPTRSSRLDAETIFRIARETRMLAHARAVRGEDVGDLQLLASNIWLHGSGLEQVRLDTDTTWFA